MRRNVLFIVCCAVACLAACQKQTTVDDVVNMVVQASGGAEKLLAIEDQVSTWDFTMKMMPEAMEGQPEMEADKGEVTGGQEMAMEMVIYYKRPNKIRMDFGEEGNVVMSAVYDGMTGWESRGGERREKTEAELKEDAALAETWIDGFLNCEEKGYTLELLPNETLDDRDCLVVQTTKDGHVMKYHIDAETHHVMRQSGEMLNMQKEIEPMYLTFSDYKMADDIAWAHYVSMHKENGEMVWEATLKEARHNTGVADELFKGEEMSVK
ncbi:MAG: hypothetical protein ACE5IY_22575 [bacterium]